MLLVRGPGEHNPVQGVIVEAVAAGAGRAQRAIDDIRRLSIARNVFRATSSSLAARCSSMTAGPC